MQFKNLPVGEIFEYREQATKRVGVKISDKDAWLFQEQKTATLAYNRHVYLIGSLSGRLMRYRDGRACVVNAMGESGQLAGHSVIPIAFVSGVSADFTAITVDAGHVPKEVDIILNRISQSNENVKTLVNALKVVLSDVKLT